MNTVPSFSRSQAVESAVRSLKVLLATTLLDVREWLAGLRTSHSTISPGHCAALPRHSSAQRHPCARASYSAIDRKCPGLAHSRRLMDSRSGNARRGRASMDRFDRRWRRVDGSDSRGPWRHPGNDRSWRMVHRCPSFRTEAHR